VAFTVEDGTGVAGANAYISVAEAKAYWDDRGFAYGSYSDPQIQVAIVKATDYIEQRYRLRFKGLRESSDQPLSFPRIYLYDANGTLVSGVGARLKAATAEYAQRALSSTLAPDPAIDDTNQVLARKRQKVGPIETDTTFTGGVAAAFRPYPTADALLEEYLSPSGGRVYR